MEKVQRCIEYSCAIPGLPSSYLQPLKFTFDFCSIFPAVTASFFSFSAILKHFLFFLLILHFFRVPFLVTSFRDDRYTEWNVQMLESPQPAWNCTVHLTAVSEEKQCMATCLESAAKTVPLLFIIVTPVVSGDDSASLGQDVMGNHPFHGVIVLKPDDFLGLNGENL